MALFPQQFIDDLRLQANILTIVQEYVPLKKAGSAWKGLCPFHSEKTPSFQVNPDKGFFNCFGCGVGGDIVDRFRNRLMIPICRDTGSVIAFGGRQMDPDQGGPKYLNSPETPIYSKSRTLYGLNLTKKQIGKSGFAVLVEGYFDFAQLFQSQAAPAVASCGTALTPQQAQLLRRFTSNIVLSFDPDAAGQGAATRSCEMLVTEGFDVNVVVLDKGEDPDTFIRKKGADHYRARLRTSRPYLEYLLDQAAKGLDFGHDDSRREFLGKMLTVAARI